MIKYVKTAAIIGILVIHLLGTAFASPEWIDTDGDGETDTLQLDAFQVNSNDPETFDWEGYFDFVAENDLSLDEAIDALSFTFGYSPVGAGGGAPSTGNVGAVNTNNTFPFNQTSNASCGLNAVRNAIKAMRGVGESEMEIGERMAEPLNKTVAEVFGNNGIGVDKPNTQLNAGLNPSGLKAIQSGWNNSTEAESKFRLAAQNDQVMIIQTKMNGINHMTLLIPTVDANNILSVREIDSGYEIFGNARDAILTSDQAAARPTNFNGATGNVYLISEI